MYIIDILNIKYALIRSPYIRYIQYDSYGIVHVSPTFGETRDVTDGSGALRLPPMAWLIASRGLSRTFADLRGVSGLYLAISFIPFNPIKSLVPLRAGVTCHGGI